MGSPNGLATTAMPDPRSPQPGLPSAPLGWRAPPMALAYGLGRVQELIFWGLEGGIKNEAIFVCV